MIIDVFKARSPGPDPTPDLIIKADVELPESYSSALYRTFDDQARLIIQAMQESLPEGVLTRVFAQLAQMYATNRSAYQKSRTEEKGSVFG